MSADAFSHSPEPQVSGEPTSDDVLVVDVTGFEGPLDLLLTLARTQKLDITRISILTLAEQYLAYIKQARQMQLELAADYLVMASWLAYLKSRLLLPVVEDEEPSGEEMADALAFRLQRLEALRGVSARLVNRSRLGRDVFPRGMPEDIAPVTQNTYTANLVDLLKAYAIQRQRTVRRPVVVPEREVLDLAKAREILTQLVGRIAEWTPISVLLCQKFGENDRSATVLASSFAASLELVRDGRAELRQDKHFAPVMIRGARDDAANTGSPGGV